MLRQLLSSSAALLRASLATAPLAMVALSSGSAPAQCYTDAPYTGYVIQSWSANYNGYSAFPIPLGFAFPMAGASSPAFYNMRVGQDGWIQLTNAPLSAGLPSTPNANSPSALTGAAGSEPRIAPFWANLLLAPSPATAAVIVTSNPGSCRINWQDMWDASGHVFSFSAELFADGSVVFAYDHRANSFNPWNATPILVGVSTRNGVALPPASDFVPGPTNPSSRMIFQSFPAGTFDGQNKMLTFTPTAWGWSQSVSCNYVSASHAAYGTGCYDSTNSFYELHGNAAAASAALTGQAYRFTPFGSLYRITSGGSFLPPIAPANVFASPSDDGEAQITPSLPLPTPYGPQASLRVHANGVVSWGAGGQTFPGTSNWVPTAAGFLGGANAGVYAWHDYNESEPGSGRIVYEERTVGGDTVLVITWNGVESYASPEVANPSTMQIQCNLGTGVITLVFPSLSADSTSQYGSEHLIGCSPPGASPDGGSQSFATSLPRLAGFDATPMTLSATPAPISTGGAGTLVTYTQSNIPELAPGTGVRLGVTILSFGQDPLGTDLAFLGMPGCNLHLASLDVTTSFLGFGSSLSTQLQVPAGVPYGTEFFAQSAALIPPNTLNAFGATLSNAIASFVSTL